MNGAQHSPNPLQRGNGVLISQNTANAYVMQPNTKQESVHQMPIAENGWFASNSSNGGGQTPATVEEGTPTSVATDEVPPDRSSSASAPPILELSSNSLFAWDHSFANVFSGQYDIRASEDYYKFYEEYGKSNPKLPPPLEAAPFVADLYHNVDEQFSEENSNNMAPGAKFLQGYFGNGFRQFDESQQPQPKIDEAQQELQRMNLSRSQNMNIPTQNIWTPLPRKIARVPAEAFNENENPTTKDGHTYGTSPSAQTAIKTAQFLFGEEEKDSVGSSRYNQHFNSNQFNGDGMKIKQIDNSMFGFDSNGNNAHNNNIGHEANATRSNIICRYYAAGYCSRGEKCYYSHDIDASQQGKIQKPDVKRTPNNNNKTKSPRVSANGLTPINVPSHPSTTSTPSQSNIAPTGHTPSHTQPQNVGIIAPAPVIPPSNLVIPQSQPIPTPTPTLNLSSPTLTSNSTTTAPGSPGKPQSPVNPATLSPRSQEQLYTNFDQLIGKIYLVSKDQQGCRFLQKKLEEQEPKVVDTIFNEVYDHINELMIDPFGNYLCQKLLEHCTDEHRYKVVEKVASDLVTISKNMHGTRAVQKMIECLSSPPQIDIVKRALGDSVVELIQDLNGNHVIQRCLHRLAADDNNQFIYNAVTSGNNCVQVATHRHGCCVLQRCIDNASEKQKVQLIHEIIKNALTLVQDPYGNYVVQYVLDLPFPELVEGLAASFVGHIRHLSTQKFSSNVIEKSLNAAKPITRHAYIKELLGEGVLAQLLQDPFANYVIQTALNVSEPEQHLLLIEAIKPFLNQLKNTPYGKRIQNKIAKETAERSKGRRD